MPLYEYICETCHSEFEVRRSFSDTSTPACPSCNGTGQVRRKFTAPAIVFKGSGFYVTDSRGKNSANGPSSRKSNGKAEKTASTEKKTETKAKAKD
ncbi:MAG: zinc ribbon domain-containing protein [Chloroflexi bacterium]|nr:zinc ribbon domain-containing protein [Chloroflexota bacterium]